MAHEFGHIIATNLNDFPEKALMLSTIVDTSGNYVSGLIPGTKNSWQRTPNGYRCSDTPCMMHPIYWLPGGPKDYEEWADMWMNWTYGSFADNPMGDARRNWMNRFLGSLMKYVQTK